MVVSYQVECENPFTAVGDAGVSFVYEQLSIRTMQVNSNAFNVTMKFTSNHYVDPAAPIWIGFCTPDNQVCTQFMTNKRNLAGGNAVLNFSDFGTTSISNLLTYNISTSDVVGPNDKFIIVRNDFELCNNGKCVGQKFCPEDQDYDMAAVNQTCTDDKICSMGSQRLSKNFLFSDYGIAVVADTFLEHENGPYIEKRETTIIAAYRYNYYLFASFRSNFLQTSAYSANSMVTVSYNNGAYEISETLPQADLDTTGLTLQGKNVTSIKLSWDVVSGADSYTITKFQVCETDSNSCSGIRPACAPSNATSFDICPMPLVVQVFTF